MGTWGTGNFDNDAARDLLDTLVLDLIGRARTIVADDERVAVDVEGEGGLVPLVDILRVLCRGLDCGPPPSVEVLAWRDRYLKVFDEQMPELADEEFTRDRRETVRQTFDDLVEFARDYERSVGESS